MKTQIFSTSESDLKKAAAIIKAGGLVALPTETVYGLGADALNSAAVKNIYSAKGRESDNPLIVHISEINQWGKLVKSVPENAKKLARAFWPGPLTIILPKSEIIPMRTSGGLATVAVRMPVNETARRLISLSGCPIAAPSANISGAPSPTKFKYVYEDMNGKIDAIIDGGDCEYGVESTVITLATPIPVLLRPSAITLEQLQSVLGEVRVDKGVTNAVSASQKVASPGMKYKHYSPKANVIIIDADDKFFAKYVNSHSSRNTVAMCYEEQKSLIDIPVISLGYKNNSLSQAQRLFNDLRKADEMGAKTVYTPMPKSDGIGLAVANRLLRAAAFEIIKLGENHTVIGITGQSGSGKTTVSERYRAEGAYVINADEIAHEVLNEKAVLKQIEEKICSDAVKDGLADRKKISKAVFGNKEKLLILNEITHPVISNKIKKLISFAEEQGYADIVLDAPTLIESGLYKICDEIIFVKADISVRLKRIMARDNLDIVQAQARLNSEKKDEFFMEYADKIIENN